MDLYIGPWFCWAYLSAVDYPRSSLSTAESRLVALCEFINERPAAKRVQSRFLNVVGRRWVHACTKNVLDVAGLEHAHALRPERGVMICSNHRSFFDMYVISAVMIENDVPWYRDQYFPVRSKFFYDGPLGMVVNLAMSGGAMYPPIFRERERQELNKISVDRIVSFLQRPGTVVGTHPEGTRSKGPDPLDLLKAQPGIGQMALQAGVPVLPIWIDGMGNNLPKQIAMNFMPNATDFYQIRIRIGRPVDLEDLRQQKPRLTLYKKCADRILGDIRTLGESVAA